MTMSTNAPLRCDLCADVIGVYEPLIALIDGQVVETSLASHQDAGPLGEGCYHRACYRLRHDSDPA
jgi:hypothetical protein